jgi:hypothetical protein
MMLAKGYQFEKHYLPHDCAQTDRAGRTLIGELRKVGLHNLVTVPRTHSVWVGINHLIEMFPSLQFRDPQTETAIEALSCYRQREQRAGVQSNDEPIHDWSSHTADGLRTMAEAHLCGLFKFSHTPAKPDSERFGTRRKRRGMKPMRVG